MSKLYFTYNLFAAKEFKVQDYFAYLLSEFKETICTPKIPLIPPFSPPAVNTILILSISYKNKIED